MRELRFLLFILLSVSCSQFANSQIVNIEKARQRTDTTGFSGGIELSGKYIDNGKFIYTFNIIPDIQYKNTNNIILLVGDYKVTKSKDIDFQDAAFLHLRYGHEFSDLFRAEAFSQIQDNKITLLKFRFLLGAGPRFKMIGRKKLRLYIGLIPMYEYEIIDNTENTIHDNFRFSQYVSVTYLISENSVIYTTSYYQPKFGALADFRFFSEFRLEINFIKNFDLTTGIQYTWDSAPPIEAPRRLVQVKTGLAFNF